MQEVSPLRALTDTTPISSFNCAIPVNTHWILVVLESATCLDLRVKSTVAMNPTALPMIQKMSTLVTSGRFR